MWRIIFAGNDKPCLGFLQSARHLHPILTKFPFSRQIFIKVPNIKFHGYPSNWSRAGTNRWTDSRTDRPMDKTKIRGDFRCYEDALKAVCKYIKCIKYYCISIYSNMLGFYTSHDIRKTASWYLTLRILMSYIYGVPSKARNTNVVYIWTYICV